MDTFRMRRFLLVFTIIAGCVAPAIAQTPTTFTTGQTLPAAGLNTAFGGKVDTIHGVASGITITGSSTFNGLPLANVPSTAGVLVGNGSAVSASPIGTTANTIAAGNDSRIVGAVQATGGTLTNGTMTGGTVSTSTSVFGVSPSTIANLGSALSAAGFGGSSGSGGTGGITQAVTTGTAVIADSGSGTFTYGSGKQVLTYVKTGRQVTFNIDVAWTANDGGSGAVTISGLPAALAAGSGPQVVYAFGVTTSSSVPYAVVGSSGALTFYAGGSTGTDPALMGSALAASGELRISGSYISAT